MILREEPTMQYQLNDVVQLKFDAPEHNLPAGTRAVVVCVFDQPQRAYEIEISDPDGQCIAMLTLTADQLEPAA
jgi:hypothetical protein